MHKFHFISVVALFLLTAVCSPAQTIDPAPRIMHPSSSWAFTSVVSTGDQVVLTVEPGEPVFLPEDAGHVVRLRGPISTGKMGLPDLPHLVYVFTTKENHGFRLCGVDTEPGWTTNMLVQPVLSEGMETSPEGNPLRFRAYRQDPEGYGLGWWPAAPVTLEDAWLREERLIRIVVQPVRYRHADQALEGYARLVIRLCSEGPAER